MVKELVLKLCSLSHFRWQSEIGVFKIQDQWDENCMKPLQVLCFKKLCLNKCMGFGSDGASVMTGI